MTDPTLASMLAGDAIDARAMTAISVHSERRHRLQNLPPLTPALRVRVYRDSALRESVEAANGEPLL